MPEPQSQISMDLEAQRKVVQKSFLVAFVIFILSMIATFIGWRSTSMAFEIRKRVEFEGLAKEITNSIEKQIETYLAILQSTKGFFAASKSVERDEWSAYIKIQNLTARYPGISAMRFIQRVPDNEKEEFIQEVRADKTITETGYPEFSFKSYSDLKGIISPKPEYFVIKYMEPMENNENMLGFDVSTEPVRWEAYERAWFTGEIALSGLAMLSKQKNGFIMTVPIYRKGMSRLSFEEKRLALEGFVDMRIEAGNFFTAFLGKENLAAGIEFRVFDGEFSTSEAPTEGRVIFDSQGGKLRKPIYKWHDHLKIGSRVWTFYFHTTPEFKSKQAGAEIPIIILGGGSIFSFLLWGLFYSLATSRFRAVSMAREMTKDLRAAEEKIRSIIDTAQDAFISMDSKGLITAWNRQAETIFGRSQTEVLGKSLAEIIIPLKYREQHMKGLQRFLATGEGPVLNKRLELTALHRDGREFPVELTIWFIHVEEVYYFNAFIRDITERKQAEKALKEAQSQLIQAEKAASITELAAGAAHEVKNPLAIVLQGIGFLNQHVENKNADTSAVLREMEEAIKRADYIIQGLLNLSRSSQLVLLKENLNAVIDESLALVRMLLEHNHITAVKQLDSGSPSLMLDKGKMIQVFINLFTNAIHVMPKGGSIMVRTRTQSLSNADIQNRHNQKHHFIAGQNVVIAEVEDTGPGIHESIQSKIFDPFFTTRRTKGGTGLGLSVVRNIVEMHGGTIALNNQGNGKGACAVIVLPASSHNTN